MFEISKKVLIYSGESEGDYNRIIEIIKANDISYECNSVDRSKTVKLNDEKKEESYKLYEIKVSKKDFDKADALLKDI